MTERWRVLLPPALHPAGPDVLSEFADCTGIDEYDSRADALADLDRYDAAVVRVTEFDAETIADAAAGRLKVISKHGVGLDNVDVEAASANGVVVCNTPGANARSVAEHTILLLLAVRRNLPAMDRHVREGGWDRSQFTGHEVAGDTLGVYGLGNIGRETATLARGMGLSVLAYDRSATPAEAPDGVDLVDDSLALFERADAVSLHVPLTAETRGLVSTPELRALGPEGVVVNVARGGVVDEDALVAALDAGEVGGAGVDVFADEPPSEDHPLLDRDDVVLSPHAGSDTEAALRRTSVRAAQNVRMVYEGGLPESTVNRDALVGGE
ncbi:hydroxyacid dehydrogenase [Halospeciosus flavus]|uniref:Hydroxyacid dehydrogenase n=1 Tax=Halospeciosus flavus TaxID=3032283 RepID=A0ABD5Z0K2_9EURY|nr:hydroxyacid dehydrogenase [Halospeciosus flavus]